MFTTAFLVLFAANLLFIVEMRSDQSDEDGTCTSGTPEDFKEAFLDNCINLVQSENVNTTCNTAWSNFLGAFANKKPSEVQQSDYGPYLETIPIKSAKNKFIFWSYTYFVADILKKLKTMGADVVSSLSNPSSAIVHDIRRTDLGDPDDLNDPSVCWCSRSGNPGLDFDTPCPNSTSHYFWAEFSERFGLKASGTVFYIAEGIRVAYREQSYFVCYELNKLVAPRVTRVVVLNYHKKNKGEPCVSSTPNSFTTISEIIQRQNASYDCYDLYGDIFDKSSHTSLAHCALMVINSVQRGTETSQRHIDCSMFNVSPTNNAVAFDSGVQLVLVPALLLLLNLWMYRAITE